MPPTAAPPAQEALVPFSTRVTESMRRRAKVYAAAKDVGIQDVVQNALEEYLSKHGF
jgi:predicted HicB family RNase H-like nuclease